MLDRLKKKDKRGNWMWQKNQKLLQYTIENTVKI